MHNQLEKHENLNCSYCQELFKDLQTLNRHIYINKTCKTIKKRIIENNIDWKQVWKDICLKNKLISQNL